MKKILLLAYYFTPDLSAGSFRMAGLVAALNEMASDVEFDLLTTQPNRYHQYSQTAATLEKIGNVTVHRYALPQHKNGFIDQAKAYRFYYRWAKQFSRQHNYDLVFATSSRLFTAYLGAQIAKKQACPLFLDIRDIFVETIENILSKKLALISMPVFRWIERRTFSRANHINLVSKGFEPHVSRLTEKHCNISFIPNGIDQLFLKTQFQKKDTTQRLQILYTGNIGEGQGLHKLIPALAMQSKDFADFTIIGSGGQLTPLKQACHNLTNVFIHAPMTRTALIPYYQNSDVLFLQLNDYPAFKRVLPSKIFEYAATHKPILAGVAGFAKTFLQTEIRDVWVFDPCNTNQAYEALLNIHKNINKHIERDDFCKKYDRLKLSKQLAQTILAY